MNLGLPTSPAERAGVTRFEPLESSAWAPAEWRNGVVLAAQAIGFSRTGFATIAPFAEAGAHFSEYIAGARHGSMTYLERAPRHDPASLLPEARTLIAVALAYAGGSRLVELKKERALSANIAAYALGPDYHQVIKAKLAQLGQACANIVGRPVLARSCVDTAPLLEREAARRAGIGFIGKSTMNIIPGVGSYFLTGELLVDEVFEASTPILEGCGRCRSCLDACPTQAFVDAYTLDARRCIAYLTIEHRGVIPRELRSLIGARVFGCDVCQDVCPYNAAADKHPASPDLAPRLAPLALSLPELLALSAAGYRRLVRGSALGRATRRMLQRNAAIALGNSRHPEALEPLLGALGCDSELVRGHAAWALGELPHQSDNRAMALESLAQQDPVAWVRAEAEEALASVAKLR